MPSYMRLELALVRLEDWLLAELSIKNTRRISFFIRRSFLFLLNFSVGKDYTYFIMLSKLYL